MDSIVIDILLFYFHFTIDLLAGFVIAIRLVRLYQHLQDEGKPIGLWKYPAFVYVGLFYIADIAYNWVSTFVYFELPREWNETTSMRFDRYAGDPTSPKRQFVAKILGHILNFIDRGHIPNA